MKVSLRVGLEGAGDVSDNDVPVVIDVLRASSTICQALKSGAEGIIPVDTPERARAIKEEKDEVLLCGEQNARKLEGFDLGNSPLTYTPEIVSGKTLVLVTTNCTKALELLEGEVFIGCLNNATAAGKAVEKHASGKGKNIVLMPVGMGPDFGMEDWIAAGMIARSIHIPQKDHHAAVAENSSMLDDAKLLDLLMASAHAQRLVKLNHGKDLEFCFRRDITDVVPVRIKGVIREWSSEGI